ncbi:hypothetical protein [Gordonia sp. C13]|uniref:hypothetical protein n=1 Tax=Gordonia sp. C13 TaxID=2935078 RepID=UPI00200AA888|nr:hypothetical protein [Gordonia sp. C13]MCK8615820.1 hypothetical protein [Gordonia sp. C13]
MAVSSLQPAYGAIPSHEAGRFQINPAPLGNPNGSFDAPAIRCGAEVGKQRGVVTITGTERARWGCLIYADVRWLNLSTGATGAARMSNGLNGFPPEAELRTGSGQVVITMLQGIQGNVTPGFATASVP